MTPALFYPGRLLHDAMMLEATLQYYHLELTIIFAYSPTVAEEHGKTLFTFI